MSDKMTPPGQGPDTARTPTVTIAEAARRLGVTTDAVRRRLHRGTLAGTKDEHGVWQVYWPDEDAPPGVRPDTPGPRPDSDRALIEHLAAEVTFLRGQLDQRSRELAEERQRFDVIHREALGRIEALTAGPITDAGEDAPQARHVAPGEAHAGDVATATPVPWWRRWWRSLQGGS
jgi:hypothetical protein